MGAVHEDKALKGVVIWLPSLNLVDVAAWYEVQLYVWFNCIMHG